MEVFSDLRDFLDKGGDVLYAILFLSIWLCWLILERYYYFLRENPNHVAVVTTIWEALEDKNSWFAEVERKKLISQVEIEMLRNLKIIPVLIALLPMFGLLGTVTGMIQVFDVMAYLGSGNPRAMADGVSAATIPTMSGMVIALMAIPFATQLDRRYKKEFKTLTQALDIRS